MNGRRSQRRQVQKGLVWFSLFGDFLGWVFTVVFQEGVLVFLLVLKCCFVCVLSWLLVALRLHGIEMQ